MIHVVTGGSGSGKSAYAEDLICEYRNLTGTGDLLYIATMFPYGAETGAKIERHRQLRAGKGFRTVECYTDIGQTAEMTVLKHPDCSVLLECISNLTANELYMDGGAGELAEESIIAGITKLGRNCRNLVIVTNEVFSAGDGGSPEMNDYLRTIGAVNCRLGRIADRVTEVVYGILVEVKR